MTVRGVVELIRAPITLVILTLALVEWVRGGHRDAAQAPSEVSDPDLEGF
jgi:hypothetical protein